MSREMSRPDKIARLAHGDPWVCLDREDRERLTAIALGDAEMRVLVADRAAYRLVDIARRSRFSDMLVFCLRQLRPAAAVGHRTAREKRLGLANRLQGEETAAARQWIRDAFLAGHGVAYSSHRSGPGTGHDLECVDSDDEAWLCRELLARRLLPADQPNGEKEDA